MCFFKKKKKANEATETKPAATATDKKQNQSSSAKPVTETKPAPETKPATEPKPAPASKPATEPKPAPASKPVTEPKPAPASKPVTEPKPAPASKPATEPKPDTEADDKSDAPKKPIVKDYHVSQRDDGMWQVKFAKGEKALKLFKTQAEAIEFAKEKAANQDGKITIHKKDGKIRKQKY